MMAVMAPDLIPCALLLFVELARYRLAPADSSIVDVVPSSLIWITMAPDVTIVWPFELPVPVVIEEMTTLVEVEVEVTVRVDADEVAVLAAKDDNWLMKLEL